MSELVEFLAERLADDEKDANTSLLFVAEAKRIEAKDRRRTRNPASQWTLEWEARAKRTLAEVASKRAIIAMCSPDTLTPERYDAWQEAMHHLANAYRNHPDWREEWAT